MAKHQSSMRPLFPPKPVSSSPTSAAAEHFIQTGEGEVAEQGKRRLVAHVDAELRKNFAKACIDQDISLSKGTEEALALWLRAKKP